MTKLYKVEYLEGGTTDITNFVVSLDKFKKFSDGRISQAAFTLNSEFGQFITDDSGGATPKVDEFDRFRISILDALGVTLDSHIFELKTDLSQFMKQSNYLLPLELEGRERNMAYIPFSGYLEFENHFDMANIIIRMFESNDGTAQPIFTTIDGLDNVNELPDNNPNIWDFQYIDNCLDALKLIVTHANNSVPAGGAGDRFAIIYDDDPNSPLTTIIVRIISQGSRNNAPFPTLDTSIEFPIQSIEKLKEQKTGTRIVARGKAGSSTAPAEPAKYFSRLEFFKNIQQFDNTKSYLKDNYVRQGNLVYRAIIDVPAGNRPPNVTFWLETSAGTYIGDIQYSPITKEKQLAFRNSMGNPEGALDPSLFTSLKAFDYNMTILDAKTFRDFCFVRSITDDLTGDTFKKKYLLNEITMIDGFRILVDTQLGALAGAFAADNFGTGVGNDPNGFPYADAIAIFIKKENAWFVFRQQGNGSITAFADAGGGKTLVTVSAPHKLSNGRKVRINGTANYTGTFKIESVTATTFVIVKAFVITETGTWVTADSDECLVTSEGIIYEWNVDFGSGSRTPASEDRERGAAKTGTRKWRDASAEFLGNDCCHSPTFFANAEGLIDPINRPDHSGSITTFSNPGGGKVRATTSIPHEIPIGRRVTISGTVNYNGTFVVIKTTSTTFDFVDTFVITETGSYVTPTETYTKDSAIRIKYSFDKIAETPPWKTFLDQLLGILAVPITGVIAIVAGMSAQLFALFATPYYTSAGWWISWASPYPFSTHNAIDVDTATNLGLEIGEIYGGDANSIQDHHFFDAYNERFTFTGKEGWNQDDSDTLMEITGFSVLYKLNMLKNSDNIPFTGEIPVAYWMIDNNGTIWKSKDTYRFLGDVQRFDFYFGNFTPVFRARSPLGISNIIENLLVPELELRDIFFRNKILFQGFQLELPYDDKGRYMPNLIESVIKPTAFNLFSFKGLTVPITFDGTFDVWAWIKTPIAISATDAESAARAIYPDIKDYPQITNIEQLQRASDAQLDIEEFRYEQYSVTNFNVADRKLQDTVFLHEQFMIDETDNPGNPNTREVVVSEINYESTKGEHLKRTMIITRRIPKIV